MSNLLSRLQSVNLPQKESEPVLSGRLTRVVGLTLEAVGLNVPVGVRCRIDTASGPMLAEVVGFDGSTTYLMPTTDIIDVQNGNLVTPVTGTEQGTTCCNQCRQVASNQIKPNGKTSYQAAS